MTIDENTRQRIDKPLRALYAIDGKIHLLHLLACICHVAQEHVQDPEAWDHNNLGSYLVVTDYTVACFLAQNTVEGHNGVECNLVLDELCKYDRDSEGFKEPKSIEKWKKILQPIVDSLGGWLAD